MNLIAQPEKRGCSDLVRRFMRRRVGYRQRKRLEALEALEDLRQRYGIRGGDESQDTVDDALDRTGQDDG